MEVIAKVRNGEAIDRYGMTWEQMDPYPRAWFFGAPAFAAPAVILTVIGLIAWSLA